MRFLTTVVVAGATISTVAADLCSDGSSNILGNWYCQAVKSIKYSNVGVSGDYPEVTGMDSSGNCQQSTKSFSGDLAPFDEELSVHFRGPLILKNFAVYYPKSSSKAKRDASAHHHGHQHFHKRDKEILEIQERAEAPKEERGVGDVVVATIDGQVVSWVNEYDGSATSLPENVAPVNPTTAPPPPKAAAVATSSASPAPAATASAASSSGGSGDWTRVSYYNADSGTADGVTFLNNMGGQGSGVFDYVFGNSLSYASSDGSAGAASPQVLSAPLKSNQEIVLLTSNSCNDGGCGYTRPGSVAYHGWGGAAKVFVAEFQMPDDGTSGWNMNMPAYWLLNANIPRIGQYLKQSCSCWPKCGEVDVVEVLDSGNTRCKSTIHGFKSGGDSDYFDRPAGAPITVAVVFNNNEIHIEVLDSFAFADSLSNSEVDSIATSDSPYSTSIFDLYT